MKSARYNVIGGNSSHTNSSKKGRNSQGRQKNNHKKIKTEDPLQSFSFTAETLSNQGKIAAASLDISSRNQNFQEENICLLQMCSCIYY